VKGSVTHGEKQSVLAGLAASSDADHIPFAVSILLLGALSGANLAGWLDPFSFFCRSLTIAVFPAVNAGIKNLFEWIYRFSPAFAGEGDLAGGNNRFGTQRKKG
jgi:hypothetical protein